MAGLSQSLDLAGQPRFPGVNLHETQCRYKRYTWGQDQLLPELKVGKGDLPRVYQLND